MTEVYDGTKKEPHPEEAAPAAVSKDARRFAKAEKGSPRQPPVSSVIWQLSREAG
jgi:hypothetical protein